MAVECRGCGGSFPDVDGPTHPYMRSSPGCWAAYNEVLAREYRQDQGFGETHRLIVDAYAVQHPRDGSAANLRSVGFHLCRLCLLLERGLDPSGANASMETIAALKTRFIDLVPSRCLGDVTIADVHQASGPGGENRAVRRWAMSVWQAWSQHHPTVREWVDIIFPDVPERVRR